jgi:hypothetical protein
MHTLFCSAVSAMMPPPFIEPSWMSPKSVGPNTIARLLALIELCAEYCAILALALAAACTQQACLHVLVQVAHEVPERSVIRVREVVYLLVQANVP